MPDRALARTWPSDRADKIEIFAKMASQLLLKLRQIPTATQWVNFDKFSRSLAHRPINMYPNLCHIELWLVHGRQIELTELKYLPK